MILHKKPILVFISGFLCFFSFGTLIPELPRIIAEMRGEGWKGFAFTLFSISAIISRPFAGRIIDKLGAHRSIKIGLYFSIIGTLLYFPYYLTFFLIARFIHGLSKGIAPTAMTASIIEIAPANQRALLLGHFTIATSLGVTLGPAIGGYLFHYYGITFLYLSSFVSSFMAFLFILPISLPVPAQKTKLTFTLSDFKITKDDFLFMDVLPISIIQFIFALEFGIVITLLPFLNTQIGLENNGIFFLYYTVASIGIRFFTSDLSDKYGRDISLVLTGLFYGFTIISFAFVTSPLFLYIVSIAYGISRGLMLPIMFGQVADYTTPQNRGKVLSTFFIFMELGTAVGSAFSSFFSLEYLYLPFVLSGILILASVIYWKFFRSLQSK